MIRAVILDFNGVLVDDEAVHFELLRDVLLDHGIEMTERAYHEEYLGYDDRGCIETALTRAGRPAPADLVESLIERKAELYGRWAESELRSFPAAAETVRGLAARWPVAICSGALEREIRHALQWLGLHDFITCVIAAEDTDRCKPDPEGYLLALDALRAAGVTGLEAAHCLAVEDSLAGIRSAKAAGMWVVGVPHTYASVELRSAGADAVAGTLAEVTPDWIVRLFHSEVSP